MESERVVRALLGAVIGTSVGAMGWTLAAEVANGTITRAVPVTRQVVTTTEPLPPRVEPSPSAAEPSSGLQRPSTTPTPQVVPDPFVMPTENVDD